MNDAWHSLFALQKYPMTSRVTIESERDRHAAYRVYCLRNGAIGCVSRGITEDLEEKMEDRVLLRFA